MATTPSIKTVFISQGKAEVNFPENDVVFPKIPKKLLKKEIPPHVIAWLADTDEMGWIIQDMLQAPTRSFCRIYRCISAQPSLIDQIPGPDHILPEIADLPFGIKLPGNLLTAIDNAKRLENWIIQGKRVAEWAKKNGASKEPWI